ncbi:MAG: oligosaccharide flippase family protein [Steroidobacteraceae bacterium]
MKFTLSGEPVTLKKRVLRAGAWSLAGHGLGMIIRLGGNLVMTRLLVPDMFGVMAIATMVILTLGMLSDVGLHQNIIQSPRGDDPTFLDTAWVVQIIRGLLLWLIAFLLSVALYLANFAGIIPAGTVYAVPELPFVIIVVSFSAVISGFRSTKWATAQRRFDQKRMVQITLIGQGIGLVVMIIFGTFSRTIWALAAGGLIASLTTTALTHAWMNGHSNRFRWDKKAFMEIRNFGKWIFLSSAVTVLASNGDRLLLGGFVDPHVLGLYVIAAFIIGSIQDGLGNLFTSVSFPALSEVARNNPSRLQEIYYRLRIPSDLLLLFISGSLFAAGQFVIDLLYDQRYSEAGNILQILALSLFGVRYGLSHQIYLALNEPRYLAIVNVVRLASLYLLVPLLYHFYGFQAAVWGIALHILPTIPLIFVFNTKLGISDIRRELYVLPAMLAGYLSGLALNMLAI